MGAFEESIHPKLEQARTQLEKLKLQQRDNSLKYQREVKVLKRLVANLSTSIGSEDSRLQNQLLSIRQDLEQQKDVSKLIPQFAVLERMLNSSQLSDRKQFSQLHERVQQGGETLLRVIGLPAQLKRDLRNLLNFADQQTKPVAQQATVLLSLYERAIKIISSNGRFGDPDYDDAANRLLVEQLAQELQHLITELDFHGESGDRLMDIRTRLLSENALDQLLELTLETLKLVIEGTKYERNTSEQFLEQVNSSIATAIKTAGGNLDQSEAYQQHRSEMNHELETLVTQSRNTLAQDNLSADKLKESLSPIFSELSSLTERLKKAEEREKALLERMSYGSNQLKSLQETTMDYRRRLDDQAQRMLLDPLTKVYNRAAFTDRLELEFRRWIRTQHPLYIALIDIDNFKSVNDSFGYTAGDKALKIIARTVSKNAQDTDTVARFAGQEFILIMPEQSKEAVEKQLSNIQNQIRQLPFKFRDQNLSITATVSISRFEGSDTPEAVVERLAKARDNAKRFGNEQLTFS
ncbi:sensor domain-containing diguanylate cyclase [Vibrio maerlii]|uniref:sensor domain-containing diguanylate cyclase n=1 Tax=Vibrio maerlii TaxID=2231648 RepID=UPI000E3CAEEA|nr:GGDEF domain-containing protein [Vibrio maerlii]